jgi:hypothetical protein
MTLIATSRDEKVARRAFCGDSRASVVRCWCSSLCAERQSSASRVVCRCLEWPQAGLGLPSAATLSNRRGEGLLALPLGQRAEACSTWPRTDVEGWRLIATRE